MPAWLPASGLIREHHDYGLYCTDAPPIYHVAAMLTALSAAVADTAMLVIDQTPHPLNLWTMIVGKSSSDRKTTATRLAVDRVENALNGERIQRVFGSPEGFIEALSSEPTSLLYIPEGAAFFEQQQASYWRHAKGMFMDLYDWTPLFRRRLARGKSVEIENPRLSILSACALALLDHHSREIDWLGGFLPRFLMVMGDKTEFRPMPRADEVRAASIESQVFYANQFTWGAIAMTSSAQRVIEDFNYEINADQEAFHENLHPALNRLPEMATRLSALYEIAEKIKTPKVPLVVSAKNAQHAVALCRDSRDVALRNLADATQNFGEQKEILRLEKLVRQAGIRGVQRSEILRKSRMQVDRFDKFMLTLVESEAIRSEERKVLGKVGRPPRYFVHVEAKNDEVRAAQNKIIDPEPSTYIDLEGDIDLSGLPRTDPDDLEPVRTEVHVPRWDDDDDDPTRWN